MDRITVDLGERSYPIYVGNQTFNNLGEICISHRLPERLAIITDRNVANRYLHPLSNMLRHYGFQPQAIIIPPGERQKSFTRLASITGELLSTRFPRSGAIMAFGGGVVGDIAGLVAATFRRGLTLIQVPTTLLAQVESAIGGKTGINHPLSKNAIGAYHQPAFVFSDVALLSTLPRREVLCGMGELLKYAILDEEIHAFISLHLDQILRMDPTVVHDTLVRCNSFKAKLISEDEREFNPAGGRMVLNLGHTIGHAVETVSNYRLRHGEAVLVGLRCELGIAREEHIISRHDAEAIEELLDRVGFRVDLRFLKTRRIVHAVFGGAGKARFVLPQAIGQVFITDAIKIETVESVIRDRMKTNYR